MNDAGKHTGQGADLLIEIGCEELPPKALDELRESLFESVCAGLEKENLLFDRESSQCWSSPRRLAMFFAQTAASQPDLDQERRGPSVDVAYDAEGKLTAAAEGFARSAGVETNELQTLETDKGAWLVARVHIAGKSLNELIYPLLEQALKQLPVPRPMRWASNDFSFVRPVHWLVVLHGSDVIPGELLGNQAGNSTRGHRIHSPGPHTIPKADRYLEVLRTARVLADPEERKQVIVEQATQAAADVLIEPALLEEVKNLVEWPAAICCSFDNEFLKVPHRALIASMQDHQKFFPVASGNEGEQISNRFVAIANLDSLDPEQVREGFERVIRPRLADARFFLEQDQKKPLSAYAAGLDDVIFQKKIGTLGDKSRRLASLSMNLAEYFDVSPEHAEQAALLCKCDLLTQMVGEFPELQGYMGRQYALHSGIDAAVSAAIEEHYQPRFAGDTLPTSAPGQLLGLADRVDTLVGIFAAGLRPTGNKDPFALRRGALGLVRILLEKRLAVPLQQLFTLAADQFTKQGVPKDTAVGQQLLDDVHEFVLERARSYFRDAGYEANLVSAAINSGWSDLPDLEKRLQALAAFMGEEPALALAAANKRIGNILRKSEEAVSKTIDEDILILDEERLLFEEVKRSDEALKPLLSARDYAACLSTLAGLRPAVDRFFDGVMVMDEDPALRRNRLALLALLKAQFDAIADVSVLA